MRIPYTPRSLTTMIQQASMSTERCSITFSPIINQRLTSYVGINALRNRGLSLQPLPRIPTIKPDIYDNACFEQIACAGLTQKFNGSPDHFIPTLNWIHVCQQNEVWYSAAITDNGASIDLVQQFSKVPLSLLIKDQAKIIWTRLDSEIHVFT